MAVSALPKDLAREVEGLPRHFEIRSRRLVDQVVLEAIVRGVPVTLYLGISTYPTEPPRLELGEEWRSPLADRRGRLQGLTCLERWNRTLGIGMVLRELEQQFRTTPPTRGKARPRGRLSLWKRLKNWFAALLRRKKRADGLDPEEIRARYEDLIREKADRLVRYRQAVDHLVEQLDSKKARIAELAQEVEGQEKRRNDALANSRKTVEALEAAGSSTEEIRHDANYQQGLAEFQEATAVLEEDRQEAREMEEEARRLHELVEQHQGRLEELHESLEDLREEAAEKVAELAATQIETEIHDAATGLSPNSFGEELAELRRQVEEIESSSRVAREMSQLEASAQGREFLASGRAASATETFEALLGLSAAVDDGAGESRLERDKQL